MPLTGRTLPLLGVRPPIVLPPHSRRDPRSVAAQVTQEVGFGRPPSASAPRVLGLVGGAAGRRTR